MVFQKDHRFLILWLALVLSIGAQAGIKLPAIIGSGMVLQQQSQTKLWGWTDSGQTIAVHSSWNGQSVSAVANDKGYWEVNLSTPGAGGPYWVEINAGPEKVLLEDVMIGEVWFCSGQSNMEFPVGKTSKYWHVGVDNFENEVATANYPQIRLFTVAQRTSETPLDTLSGQWLGCNPANVNDFSAVAYFFGRMLHQNLHVPIGLIHASWGGTPAEAWTRRGVLEGDASFKSILENEAEILRGYPEANAQYQARLAKWKEGVANGTITGRAAERGPSAPMGPGHSKMPSVLYNGMVAPVIPYTIKGAIWYQGESNNDDTELYTKLFPAMVQNWRDDWQLGDFPFYFVQIASHYRMKPELREAQAKALSLLPHMGMAVTLDVGDSTDIHPIYKRPVGERLALCALAQTYGKQDLVYSGPVFRSAVARGSKMTVAFDHVGSGLKAKDGRLDHFEVAGADGVFVAAQAKIKGATVEVSSPTVRQPKYVRYAWKNYLVPDLFNKEGLPAAPFRNK
ncbi:MAG: sialate O-acetylesterase [Breznakibacter sp.]